MRPYVLPKWSDKCSNKQLLLTLNIPSEPFKIPLDYFPLNLFYRFIDTIIDSDMT